MTMEQTFKYSEISTTGQLPERPDNVTDQEYKAWICSKALSDWGVCMMGTELPAKFGEGMARVGEFLNVSADPESLKKYANEFILNKGIVSEL